ncbi:hypothetical protein Tco_0912187 [Tanacetum coccineum]
MELSQLKQADHSTQLLESVKSQLPTMVDDLLSIRIGYATRTALESYTKDFEKKAQEERKLYIDVVEKLVKGIIKEEVKSLLPQILPKEVSDFATLVIQSTINESLKNVVLDKSSSQPKSTYEAAKSLTKLELKKILLDKIEISESYKTAPEHKELYEGLVKSYNLDKDLFSSYGNVYSLKRDRGNKDKMKTLLLDQTEGTKSQPKPSGGSVQAEEPILETADTEMPQDQGGDTKDQPNVEATPMDNWFKKPNKPLTPDHPWNDGKSIDSRSPQKWISNIAKARQPPRTFNELMSTPIDFSAYVMHNLKIDNLTQEILGPKRQKFYGYASNRESKHDVFSRKRIIVVTHVKVMKWYGYGYLEEIIVRKEDQTLRKFKEGDFSRLNLRDIEDLMLLLVQKKLSNLEQDVIFDLNVALRMFTRCIVILKRVEDLQLGVESYQKKLNITKPETFRSDISKQTPYIAYKNPQGIIYQDKFKRNRLIRSDELYKFCDGILTYVRRVLHDIANNLRMDYLPKRIWSNLDRKRSRIMIKVIDQQLFERRLMRNLEKFVGGREYGNDFRLLKRTI